MSKKRIIPLFILICLSLTGCVSDSEYEALEKRVSYLESQMGVHPDQGISVNNDIDVETDASDNSSNLDNWKTTEISEGIPDSNEYDEFTVILTPENIKTYISLYLCGFDSYTNIKDVNFYQFIHKSNVYNKGWIFEEASDDFAIDYSTGEIIEDNPLGVRFPSNPFWFKTGLLQEGESIEKMQPASCSGKLRFVSIRHVMSDDVDDMHYKRTVKIQTPKFPSGKTIEYSLTSDTYTFRW